MADRLGYKLTRVGSVNVTVPRVRIEVKVVSSTNQSTLIMDRTGASALEFPAVLATLSNEEMLQFVEMVAGWFIEREVAAL